MNKRVALIIVLVIAVAIFIFPIFTGGAKDTPEFIEQAAMSNMFEIQSSEVALSNAQREDVRNFARMMLEEHRRVGDRLREAVSTANLNIQAPQTLNEDYQEKIDELQSAESGEFDQRYIESQIEAHEDTVSLFENYAEEGENMELRQFASQALPNLQQHQNEVQQLQEQQEAQGQPEQQAQDDEAPGAETSGALQN